MNRINVMATINVRQRINVAEQGLVQAHAIKELWPTAKSLFVHLFNPYMLHTKSGYGRKKCKLMCYIQCGIQLTLDDTIELRI